MPPPVAATAWLHCATVDPMALPPTPETPPPGGISFGGFGAVAVTTSSRGRTTTVYHRPRWSFNRRRSHHRIRWCLSGPIRASRTSGSVFPAAAAGPIAGVYGMSLAQPFHLARIRALVPVDRNSVVPLSHSLDDIITADDIAGRQVPCVHLVLGRQSTDEDDAQGVILECHTS